MQAQGAFGGGARHAGIRHCAAQQSPHDIGEYYRQVVAGLNDFFSSFWNIRT
jgi:hypothetical protein